MTYKAFIASREIPFREMVDWFVDIHTYGGSALMGAEQGLIQQRRGRRVHEYNIDEGPLVQLVGTMDNDWGSMVRSTFKNMRVLGSDKEISMFFSTYNRYFGPGVPLREIRVLLPTEIGTMTGRELEDLFNLGAVIKDEFHDPRDVVATGVTQ